MDRSFFLTQLERRGVHLAAGPQAYLLALFRVAEVMRPIGSERSPDEDTCWELIEAGDYVDAQSTLEAAWPAFDRTGAVFLPVVQITRADAPPKLLGAIYHVDALRAYNRALAATAAEEHS